MKRILQFLLVIIVLSTLVSCAGSRRNHCPKGMAGYEPRGKCRASVDGKNVIIDESKYFANRNDSSDPKIGDTIMIAFNTVGEVVAYSKTTIELSSQSVIWQKAILTEFLLEEQK